MYRISFALWLVQSLSVFRIVGSLLFAAVAFQEVHRGIACLCYGMAMITHLPMGTQRDGYEFVLF